MILSKEVQIIRYLFNRIKIYQMGFTLKHQIYKIPNSKRAKILNKFIASNLDFVEQKELIWKIMKKLFKCKADKENT